MTRSPPRYSFSGLTKTASGEEAIQQMILEGGPVETAFSVYSDFENYDGGIYKHTSGSMAGGCETRRDAPRSTEMRRDAPGCAAALARGCPIGSARSKMAGVACPRHVHDTSRAGTR